MRLDWLGKQGKIWCQMLTFFKDKTVMWQITNIVACQYFPKWYWGPLEWTLIKLFQGYHPLIPPTDSVIIYGHMCNYTTGSWILLMLRQNILQSLRIRKWILMNFIGWLKLSKYQGWNKTYNVHRRLSKSMFEWMELLWWRWIQ